MPAVGKDLLPNGLYKPLQIKTVYDPSIISDSELVRLGQIAAAKGYQKAVASNRKQFTESAGGIDFRVYLDKNGTVTNFHPK